MRTDALRRRPRGRAGPWVGEREVSWAGAGLLRIRQRVQVRGSEPGADTTGPYWVFALVEVHSGTLQYLHGSERVVPPWPRFAVFMSPWSIVRTVPSSCVVSTAALASSARLFERALAHAVAWRWNGGELPTTIEGVAQAVSRRSSCVNVSREVDPTLAARRSKRIIDASYCRPVTLASVAAQARLSPSVLSRSFKRAYGMPPVEYRHRLRVMDAMFRLAAGGEILTVLQDVGFGDASRFYSHFRSLLCAPPGRYSARSRNAKT